MAAGGSEENIRLTVYELVFTDKRSSSLWEAFVALVNRKFCGLALVCTVRLRPKKRKFCRNSGCRRSSTTPPPRPVFPELEL